MNLTYSLLRNHSAWPLFFKLMIVYDMDVLCFQTLLCSFISAFSNASPVASDLFKPIVPFRKKEEELSKELELDIKGAEKPSFWELLGVRFLLLPYTIGKVGFPFNVISVASTTL